MDTRFHPVWPFLLLSSIIHLPSSLAFVSQGLYSWLSKVDYCIYSSKITHI